jgi:hypothetical protein
MNIEGGGHARPPLSLSHGHAAHAHHHLQQHITLPSSPPSSMYSQHRSDAAVHYGSHAAHGYVHHQQQQQQHDGRSLTLPHLSSSSSPSTTLNSGTTPVDQSSIISAIASLSGIYDGRSSPYNGEQSTDWTDCAITFATNCKLQGNGLPSYLSYLSIISCQRVFHIICVTSCNG